MNNLDKQYMALLQDILDNGTEKKDRTGTGTLSVFGRQIRHKMSDGFPLLTTKKMHWKSIVTELLWFLRGDTNIKYLVDNDCHIWNGDAYKNYEKNTPEQYVVGSDSDPMRQCMVWKRKTDSSSGYPILERLTQEEFIDKIKTNDEFAEKWGDLGPVYGKQWRDWSKPNHTWGYDQISNLINDLKTNPDSRRLMVNAWNVGEIDQMVLPPCHYGFQVYTRELSEKEIWSYIHKNKIEIKHQHAILYGQEVGSELRKSFIPTLAENYNIPTRAISLMWNQRSVDTFLGLPFNIASYGLLLEIIAKEVNMIPDELIGNLGDTHLYLNHIEQAKEQIDREPFELPVLKINDLRSDTNSVINDITKWSYKDFQIEDYQSHPTIKAPLSN